MSEAAASSSWYRVAALRPRLRSHARIHRHRYRGQTWYVLQDLSTQRFLRFTPAAVLVFRALTYVLVLGAIVRFLVLPLSKGVSDRRVALYIEEREPSLQASLISAIDSQEDSDAGSAGLSPALAEKLVQSAADR